MVTLLSLPQHYNTQAAGQWQQELTGTPEFFDANPLSYAAVYHGWVAVREETTPFLAPLRYLPPDGFAGGMIAAREIGRGTWIAPANVALQNAADLRPLFKDEEWLALYQRQMNIVRRQPGRYALMSAMTLSRDRHYRQLSVRRLLILLRKLALREGQRYVFETNNERFRALVQTYFENILNQILERGGLQAFQVVTNEEINTPNDYDNGRFLIALKVAPTLPIEFITITMLRSNNDAINIVEGFA
jgi:phage tail sheath protein FI